MRPRVNHSQHAYATIRDQITSGQLLPGAVVSEAALAKELGLSRTPVGEALRRLSHEGLVDQIPRFGTVVRTVSPEELHELFEIREALESMAASKAALHITPEVIEELQLLCEAIDAEVTSARSNDAIALEDESLRRFLAADMAFHMLVISAANNRRLSELLDQTRSISAMFLTRRGVHSIDRVVEANRWHRQIVGALVERQPEQAAELVRQHIQSSCQQSLQSSEAPAHTNAIGALMQSKSLREGFQAARR